MTVWLVGHGIVGRRLERLLSAADLAFHDPRIDGELPAGHGDVVVMTHPVDHAPLAVDAARRGASVVSLSDDVGDIHDLLEVGTEFEDGGGTLVVGAGVCPGLSGLVARRLADQLASVDEIHVAVHGTAGPACARAHHSALRHKSIGWHDGEWHEYVAGSGRDLSWFPEPVGAMDCYRAQIAAPILLHRSFPGVDRITGRRSATRRDRFTARLPMLRPPHREGGVGALRVEVRGADDTGGRICLVAGIAEMTGTAAAATAAAFTMSILDGLTEPGLLIGSDANVDVVDLLRRVRTYGIRLQEFTGIPQPG